MYGPNGLGGAVDVTTIRPGRGPLLDAILEVGGISEKRMAARATGRAGIVALAAYGGWQQRDAWALSRSFDPARHENGDQRDNSDASVAHAGLSVRVEPSTEHVVDADALYLDGSRGVPPSAYESVPRFWRFTTWRGVAASAGHRGAYGPVEVDELAYLRWFENVLDGYDDDTYRTQETPRSFHSTYRDLTAGGRLRLRAVLDPTAIGPTHLRLWAGAQHDRHVGDPGAGNPEETFSRTLVTFAPEAEAFFDARWSAMLACQLDTEIPGEGVADRQAAFGWGPLASVRWEPVDGLSFRATGARRTRFPTLKERFSQAFGFRKPNPDLGPEAAWHAGLDVSWRATDWLTIDVGGYDAEVSGLIERVALGGGVDQLQNVGRARLAGAEVRVALRPVRELRIDLGYAFLHARLLDAAADELPSRPGHKATAEVVATPLEWLDLSSTLRVTGPRPYRDPDTTVWGTLPTCVGWDARVAARPHPAVEAWVRATNLLDSDCSTEYGFPEPGRELWVGVRLSFERERSGEERWETPESSP
jgi:iron complex outermembrane receptor protein